MRSRRSFRLLTVVLALLVLAALLLARLGQAPAPGSADAGPQPATTASAVLAGEHTTGAPPRQAPAESTRKPPPLPAFLPPEAAPVIGRIQDGGRFPHRQDGSTFGNREQRLPRRQHGWYREYTVPTPGLSHRGARRIVTGGDPPSEWYYTDDHYDSFRAFQPAAAGTRP